MTVPCHRLRIMYLPRARAPVRMHILQKTPSCLAGISDQTPRVAGTLIRGQFPLFDRFIGICWRHLTFSYQKSMMGWIHSERPTLTSRVPAGWVRRIGYWQEAWCLRSCKKAISNTNDLLCCRVGYCSFQHQFQVGHDSEEFMDHYYSILQVLLHAVA